MIELRDVHKAFGPKEVLCGVTLEIPTGANTVIIGYSGTGKSVLLKCIIGLLQPDRGEVLVDGTRVGDLDRDELAALRGTVGYVFQSAALFDSLSVADNIRLGLRRRQSPAEWSRSSRMSCCVCCGRCAILSSLRFWEQASCASCITGCSSARKAVR